MSSDLIPARDVSRVELAIAAWLSYAERRSPRTHRAYRDTLDGFRRLLRANGYDMDAPALVLRLHLQEYAASATGRRQRGPAAPTTYNHRIACVSSFYRYTGNHQLLDYPMNPVAGMERMRIQEYASAQPLDEGAVARSLAAIDRSTPAGVRDYALLRVGLSTGRRLAELAAMAIDHLDVLDGGAVLVTFPHAKGGKTMRDELSPAVSSCLLAWIALAYPDVSTAPADAPVWYSLSLRSRGHRLSRKSIGEVCAARLGVTKTHVLRHTFATSMERAGAPVSEIQARLGHASLDTTGKYLAQLRSAHNAYAGALDNAFAPGAL